jgi:Xaa-Pro aminopeptidase
VRRAAAAVLVLLTMPAWPQAERLGYPPEEFTARRQRLAAALGGGTLMLFGATTPQPGVRLRQDNDFYYLTGNESLNAVLVMDASSGASHLFLPSLSASDVQFGGGNWLGERDAARRYGFAAIRPLDEVHDLLASRRSIPGTSTVWLRLSERDDVNHGRYDVALDTARRLRNPFAQAPGEDAARAAAIRTQYPYFDVRDVTPHLDAQRLIKSAREIEILRHNGRISADALARAVRATAPGRYEYELEAEATYWLLRNGAQGPAYPAIVASGPMGNQWHYERNDRQMQAGDLVVMDYGGSLDHLTIDITRTWPVSGHFTEPQQRAYEAALEAQKTIIGAIRPGVARETVKALAEEVYRRRGFEPRTAYIGHYVGMSVHDVGDWNLPFQAGMVLAIEPIVDLPDQQLHIRVEDTVLVTATGAEILTGGVPKDVPDLLALVGRAN